MSDWFTWKEAIQEATLRKSSWDRRLFLTRAAALSTLPLLNQASWANRFPRLSGQPFTLGVASGDPDSTSVVLWTRLAPQPLLPDGGMKPEAVEVTWEIAEDEAMKKGLRSGKTLATPQLGHSVHVEVAGLKPDRWYWYRFQCGDSTSPLGKTRTLPATGSLPQTLRFAFASCQHYEQGLFTAYEQMARDNLDLVFHLGDYIYEYEGKEGRVRKHVGKEIESLGDYRVRHAQYRGDPLLANMHAQCPWFVTWDDHEFDNNCASDISEEKQVKPADFLLRRANAYQAYYEAMPLRRRSLPQGPDMLLYRKASFGRLAEFLVLDTRQYRTDQPNDDKPAQINEAALNPKNTMLGTRQKRWLQAALLESQGTWNVLAQQVMMAMAAVARNGLTPQFSMDQWPGYAHERMEIIRFLAERKVPNPVVLTGDIHSNWVNDLRIDDRKVDQPVVAAEFVGTSISSGGNGQVNPNYLPALKLANPFNKFHSTERGYVRCTVTPKLWTSDYIAVEDVLRTGGKISTRASFVVESGQPGIKKA